MGTNPVSSDHGSSSRYAIIETLYEGSDTVLYRGVREDDGHRVVLKVLRRDHASPRAPERLRHEYEIARALDTTAIVKPCGLAMLGEQPALVLEDFGGVSLDRLLDGDGPTPLARFFPLALRLVEALGGLHRHDIVHKDIKPQNVLLNPATGEVKITDLGIASRIPRELQHLEHIGLIEGTLAYMAPEQTGRMNRWIDQRTDLYSLGVVFYEMLTGTLPFQAGDPVAWVYCHIAQAPPPPHVLVPSIPPQLSAVVLKLLSKAAEERYQSAAGLRHDLDECFARWRASGSIPPFALGGRDLSDRFQVPQRLYGREREVTALLAVFERVVASGRPELVLVSGYSGIGKSSLVAELHRPVVRERGFFLSGKFEQAARDVPYSAFHQAFRALFQEILCASEEQVEGWRQRFREALGESGRLLADVLPELTLLLGPQPPVPELPPAEAQSRLHATLQRFVSACARKDHPVALFLDDLQWADAGSLQLLEQLATYAGSEHLLLIGAYRDNEVGPAHPLRLTLAEARGRGAAVVELVLGPLSAAHVAALVAETVHAPHAPAEQAEPLSELVYEKTGGNPFFVLQFLLALHQEGLITFDAEEGSWRWDIAAARDKEFTDNVVELMAGKLKRLSGPTRDALTLAACLGSSLELDTLAVVAGRPEAELRDALEEAVREGLLLRRDGAYRFLHDRVQQAAYSLIPAGQLAEMHLGIGRLLLGARRAEERDDALFDVVGHLNRGAALLRSQAERDEVAALNLRAGRKAKAAAAFQSAAALFAAGLALLAPASWETRHELTYGLTFERAHIAYITGSFEEAERRVEELMDRARTRHETATVVELAVALNVTRGQYARAVEIGLLCLRACDVDLPLHPTDAQVEEETEIVWKALGHRAIEGLIHLPPMTHPGIKITMGVLQSVSLPSFFVDPNLYNLVVMRMVELSLRHGNAEHSAVAYAAFAMVISSRFGRYEEAHLFGRLGHDLAQKSGLLTTKSVVVILFGHYVVFWTRHYRETYPYTREGFSAAVESGNLNNACLNCIWAALFPLLSGEALEDVLHEVTERLGFVRSVGYTFAHNALLGGHAMIQTLRGRPVRFSMPDGSELDPPAFEARLEEGGDLEAARDFYYSLKAQALFVLGSPRVALAAAIRAIAEHPPRVGPHALIVESFYYRALALAALFNAPHAPHGAGEAQPSPPCVLPEELEELIECERQLGAWARSGPDNFLHKHALVRAEIARLLGREPEASRLYEQAIAAAREGGFVQHEAIACELAAEFYRARGLSTPADSYLRSARAGYFRWGAHAKVEQLDQRYPHLVERKPIAPTVTFAVRAEQFDVLSVVKAAQSISGELKLSRLLEMLLRIVVEHAGAEEGCLLLVREEQLWLAAIETPGGAVRLLDAGEAPSAALPRSVLNYVRRSHERVLLDDAAGRHPFVEDEYFRRKRPRSVLCLPIVRQGRLIGLLYLENNLATGAFTPGRLSVVELLASQSAFSLENATLYAEVEQENAERRRAEQALKANQQMLQAIVDNSAASVYVKDREGRFLLANRQVGALLGMPSEQLLGKTDADLFPAPFAEMVREHERKVLETGAPMEWEETVPLEDGLHTFLSIKFPLGEGVMPGVLCGISTDITERKRAEQAERFLAEASRQLMTLGYSATFESVAQLPVPELSDQCIVEVLSADRTPGPTVVAGVPGEQLEALKEALRALAEAPPAGSEGVDGRAAPLVQQVRSLDPRVRPRWERLGVHAFLRVPLLARDRYFGVMTLLATAPERRYGPADLRLAEELGRRAALVLDNTRLYTEAQEAIERRDEFLVVASHELKTPLTSMQMQVQAAERLLHRGSLAGVPPARIEAMFRILGRQTSRLGRLVDELLDVTRMNAGRLTLTRAPVDLAALVREVVERMRPQLADARCPTQLDLGAPVVGYWDPDRLEQVVVNLLSNAMKYGAGGPIFIGVRRQADRVQLVIRDEGIGIAEADQDRIFERFERAVSVRNFGGIGLGLYIARSIVASHGGSIRVQSKPGAGATFVVELPLSAPESAAPVGSVVD
ncbi:AAA family ATPase [Sorangium sp. So ce448]|uniref:AAA family ATPase n=1 Tax=Sorangium sp. So ce448 TaxID=3133314 RepID=UPI003F5E5721